MDVSGAAALRSLWHFTERYDVKISLARVHQHAMEILEADGIIDDLGEDRIFDNVHEAVTAAKAAAATTPAP